MVLIVQYVEGVFWLVSRYVGGAVWGDLWAAVAGQRSSGRRVPREVPLRRCRHQESPRAEGDGYQTPAQAEAPQHHQLQVGLNEWPDSGSQYAVFELKLKRAVCVSGVFARRPRVTTASSWSTVLKGSCTRFSGPVVRSCRSCWWTGPQGSPAAWNYLHLHKIIHRDLKSPK